MKGRILIFTGTGKGKTTAALGIALRAWGHGLNVGLLHFVKARKNTGEFEAIQRINALVTENHISVPIIEQYVGGLGFLPPKEHVDFAKHKEAAKNTLEKAMDKCCSKDYDIIILDEICWAIHKQIIDEKEVLELLEKKHASLSIVLTGRYASAKLIEKADTVSEMQLTKHAYDKGILARIGIEK